MFVDRESELASLEAAWRSERAELIVVYGRRRVGKTALLRAFCENQPSAFWVASPSSEALLRRSFTDAIWQADHPGGGAAGYSYESWERAFLALGELAAERRLVVVIDEFPYLANADPSIPSVLQKVWDERLQHTRLMLILCGSHIGMMERELLEYRAPLYGRRTGQIHLRPLPLRAAAALFPAYDAVQQIETYAVLGGIPAYLTQWDSREPLLVNVEQRILNPASYLYLEPQFLLREELQEPRNYFALLQAIAQGKTRLNEISQATGMERGPASRYLAILQDLHLVERRVPVTERQPDKSRRGPLPPARPLPGVLVPLRGAVLFDSGGRAHGAHRPVGCRRAQPVHRPGVRGFVPRLGGRTGCAPAAALHAAAHRSLVEQRGRDRSAGSRRGRAAGRRVQMDRSPGRHEHPRRSQAQGSCAGSL